ncbi:MAG: MFS transporter [Thermoplasmata archaeon]|nr:MFS transporter [Thermoplasmata archaeon]
MDRQLRLLTLGVSIRALGAALYLPFFALFMYTVLHVGYVEIGLLVVLVGLVQLPFGYAGGLVADRIGRRPMILLGIFAEALTTFGLAYAFSVRSLLFALVTIAVGGAVQTLAGAAYSAYIADLSDGSQRTRAFTWYRIGFNAGFSGGVALGGILVTLAGFPTAVGVAAGVVTAAAFVLLIGLAPSPFDLELRRGRREALAIPGPAAPVGRSLRESFAVLRRDSVALEVALAFLLGTLVEGQWAVVFPLFVHNVLGISFALLGVGLALNGLVVVFGQAPTTEAAIGWRHTTLAIVGMLLYVAAFVGLGAAGLWLLFPSIAFLVAVVVLTIGENLVAIPQSTLPSNLAPAGEVGSYNGAFNTVGGAGFLGATLLGGVVLALTADPLLIWLVLVVPAVPAALLLRHAASRIRGEADRA